MNEYRSHIIWKILLAAAFILSLLVGSRIYSHYNTGADLMSIYQSGVGLSQRLSNLTTWNENDLYRSHPDIAQAISKTLNEAWYWLDQSYNQKSSIELSSYFEKGLLSHLDFMNESSVGARSSLSHQLELQHVSLDKSVVVVKDHAAEIIYNYTTNEEQYIPSKIDTIAYTAIMVLINGEWKIKNWISERVGQIEKPKESLSQKALLLNKISQIKGINYYPAEYPWLLFWKNFNQDIVERDFQLMSELGINTVRIFLPFADFKDGEVLARNTANLSLMLDLAEDHNLSILPTLFDLPVGYTINIYGEYVSQLKHILTATAHKPALLAWNIKNEPDLDFRIHGLEKTLDWLKYMIAKAKAFDPEHPISVSWSSANHLSILSDELDYLSFHMYLPDENWADKINDLRASLDKPIVLEEFGLSTRSGINNVTGASEESQHDYIENCIMMADEHHIPWMLWTLHDFKQIPDGVFGWKPWIKAKQKRFGIMKADGRPKKVYYKIKNLTEK